MEDGEKIKEQLLESQSRLKMYQQMYDILQDEFLNLIDIQKVMDKIEE